MKMWLKKFFEGMFVACKILFAIGVAWAVFGLLITLALTANDWLRERVEPTTTNIVIVICITSVVIFGLIWSTWD